MVKHLSLCLLLASTAAMSLSSGGQVPKDVITVKYDVSEAAGAEVSWPARDGVSKVKVDGLDGIVRLIVENVNPKEWRGDRSSIVESNGTSLEIRTTKANHAQIADLLSALRRLSDVAVIAEAGLYAVDRAFYEKEFAPRFSKNRSRPLALDLEEQEKLRKASRIEKPNKVKLTKAGRSPIFSLRRVVAYERQSGPEARKTIEAALVGVSLEMEARISGDRRFVTMDLTQRNDELLELRDMKANIQGEEIPLDIPRVRKSSSSTTNSITVGDGVVVVIPPAVAPPGFTPKGPIPLLFVRPTIWIGEEEAEVKRLGKKK